MCSSDLIASRPAWPTTVEAGQCGRSRVENTSAPGIASTTPPRPEPRVSPTTGTSDVRERIAAIRGHFGARGVAEVITGDVESGFRINGAVA